MVLRLPTRIIRYLRSLVLLAIAFGTLFVVVNTIRSVYTRSESLYTTDDGTAIVQPATCVPRIGQGIAGDDRHLRPVVTLDRPSAPFPQLLAGPSLPLPCLDDWLSQGKTDCKGSDAGADLKVDVVWTWVNGSDPKWKDAKKRASEEEGIFSPGFHFR